MAVDPRYIAKLISEDPNGPSDLAEYLNSNDIVPECAKGCLWCDAISDECAYYDESAGEWYMSDFN